MGIRVTIGSDDQRLLNYWEPNAPAYEERVAALKYMFEKGWNTSVSVEPCLNLAGVALMYHNLEPFIRSTFWIGKMNFIKTRVGIDTEEDQKMVSEIEAGQTDDIVGAVYAQLKKESKVRWKGSFKKVLRLPETDFGTDW